MRDTYSGFVRRLRIKRYIKCACCEGLNNFCDQCHGIDKCERVPYLVEFEAGVPSYFTKEYKLCDDRYFPLLLLVTVIEMDHAEYKRIGKDLIMEMPFDFHEALVGFNKVFTTIDNRQIFIKRPINESTQDMEKLIVKREGFVDFDHPYMDRGDLIIFCRIKDFIPIQPLSQQTIALLQQVIPPKPPGPIFTADNQFRAVSIYFDIR